mgnify:CR=1 FL=1
MVSASVESYEEARLVRERETATMRREAVEQEAAIVASDLVHKALAGLHQEVTKRAVATGAYGEFIRFQTIEERDHFRMLLYRQFRQTIDRDIIE